MHLRFPTRFDNGDITIKQSIVQFAAHKLLCMSTESIEDKDVQLKGDESLACLAVRLGLEFRATSWLEGTAERTQVERHMRICLSAGAGFRSLVTVSPSEPLLAEASWTVMSKCLGLKEAPRALLTHIDGSYLDAGGRGEVVAALLILLARDKAIQDRKAPQSDSTQLPAMSLDDFKRDGDSRIVTVLEFVDALVPTGSRPFVRGRKPSHYSKGHSSSTVLEKAFGDSFIYFNHFIKVYDFKMINRKYLWRLICRGAAVVCASNQMGVDILVPVLTGTILQPEFVSAILFQVKNNARYTNNVSPTSAILFTMMDPFKVGLFSKRDMENPLPPVLRIVLALASRKPSVTAPSLRLHRSPCLGNDKFTAYDLWIAGVFPESFGVIPDQAMGDQYRLLLDRTRNVFNGYGALKDDGGELAEGERGRINVRWTMHPGAASKDEHFQNYIIVSEGETSTLSYVVDNHVGASGSESVDTEDPEHKDEYFSTSDEGFYETDEMGTD